MCGYGMGIAFGIAIELGRGSQIKPQAIAFPAKRG